MGHSKRLLDDITAKLEADYPPKDGYSYSFEKLLRGTRMAPDILVTHFGRTICAVEIGYTRPEKLTAYRQELRIPDVRWYDKQGVLHGDVEEKTVKVKIQLEPMGDVSVYEIDDQVGCWDCPEARPRLPDRSSARYLRRFGDEAFLNRYLKACESEACCVTTHLITDRLKMWLPSYCDKCGKKFWGDPFNNDALILWCDFKDLEPRQLARMYGRRVSMSWRKVRAMIQKEYGLDLDYTEGCFLNDRTERDMWQEVQVAVQV